MATADVKPVATIFYSWQSDLPNSANRTFIQSCLERATKELGREGELKVDPRLDRDTQGAADIAGEIYQKIDQCQVFVADVSIVNKYAKLKDDPYRALPNANVMLELGYAVNRLDWGGVIPIHNLHTGPVEDLPFDIRKRRVLTYKLAPDAELAARDEQRRNIVSALKGELPKLLADVPRAVNLEVFFFDYKQDKPIGQTLKIKTKAVYIDKPETLPDYDPTSRPRQVHFGKSILTVPVLSSLSLQRPNPNYYRQYAEVAMRISSTVPASIAVRNAGSSLLNGVKLLIEPTEESLISFADSDDSLPSREIIPGADIHYNIQPQFRCPGHVEVRSNRLVVEFGKLRSGETIKSEPFRIGARYQGEQPLNLQILSDEHPPQHYQLTMDSDVVTQGIDHADFLERVDRAAQSSDD
jgi:hypothetical protein